MHSAHQLGLNKFLSLIHICLITVSTWWQKYRITVMWREGGKPWDENYAESDQEPKDIPQQLSYQLRQRNTILNYRFLKLHDSLLIFNCSGSDVYLKIYTFFYFERTFKVSTIRGRDGSVTSIHPIAYVLLENINTKYFFS